MNTEIAVLGAGCFWGVEDEFQKLDGVTEAISGYAGGTKDNPTYEEVCSGTTGHAEVVRVTFDPEKISFEDLLYTFFEIHDPTTLNRQGPDVGTQYRSVIFYQNDEQKQTANKVIETLTKASKFPRPIVTEVSPASTFFKAEEYHQKYFCKIRERNTNLR